ncbi:MAG: NUDIX domain-containing protein [Anaerolineae bacterium]|nr:NUDIX domain-containing protein [Anaerolineae bacterium]
MTARTLSFVLHGDEILLMRRGAHKRIFPNRYNGLGGFIERNEDPWTSAKREIQEESGLQVDHLRLVAIHHVCADPQIGIMLFVFVAHSAHAGPLKDTDEGTLEWHRLEDLSCLDLVEDLPFILPRYLHHTGQPLCATVTYDTNDHIQISYAEGGLHGE